MNEHDAWNITKQSINISIKSPDVREREVRWCSIGKNIGFEINGKGKIFTRPVLIIKKLSPYTLLVAPMTTKIKTGSWYPPVMLRGEKQHVCINQIRIIDSKRIYNHLGRITSNNMEIIKESIKSLYLT